MTEDIGSDKHKRPSQAEIEVAVMRQQLKEHERRDKEDLAFRTALMGKLDKLIDDGHEFRRQLSLGEEKFRQMKEFKEETTTTLTGINERVDSVEKHQASVTHKVAGAGIIVSLLLGAWAIVKDFLNKGAGS